uniref:Putative nucleocapsid protein n=1 Tax=Soybean thrips quaranja-like virus 1 TaxID=2796550 RepID=A0A7T3R0N3_9ORTO|nr:putative nucleocapsid protein [Soybean thrips quaranja-like virus 1]
MARQTYIFDFSECVEESMEVDVTAGPSSRSGAAPPPKKKAKILVDDNKKVLPESRRAGYEPDKKMKAKLYYAILSSFDRFEVMIGKAKNVKISLGVGNQIGTLLFTLHSICRKKLNQGSNYVDNPAHGTDFKFTCRGKEHKIARNVALNIWVEELGACGFEYKKDAEFIGVLSPILTIFSSFALRFNELRQGHEEVLMGKSPEGIPLKMKIANFGLSKKHTPLCEGITYPPERKSAMAQSVGPVTSMIWLMLSTDNTYARKWASSTAKLLGNAWDAEQVAFLLTCKKDAQERALLKAVCDVLILAGDRSSKKAFLPPLAFKTAIFNACRKIPIEGEEGKFRVVIPPILYLFDSSGMGLARAYREVSKVDIAFEEMMSADTMAEVLFHATFGTFADDFGVLTFMTGHSGWSTRSDIDKGFLKDTNDAPLKITKMLPLERFAKLSQTTQTKYISEAQHLVTTGTTFSGKQQANYDPELLKKMAQKDSKEEIIAIDCAALTEKYRQQRRLIAQDIMKKDKLLKGKLEWTVVSSISGTKNEAQFTNETAPSIGQCFIGKIGEV